MRKMIINENQKGFLFKNGKYIKMLDAGKYSLFGGKKIEISELDQPITCGRCSLETLLADKSVADCTTVVEVGDEELALHYVNGKFSSVLSRGKYAFWSVADQHEFKMVIQLIPSVEDINR